jgi:hypothetical protein
MPTNKAKQQAKMSKQAEARKRDLTEMRMKLLADAKGKPAPELPRGSVRLRKGLQNRTSL